MATGQRDLWRNSKYVRLVAARGLSNLGNGIAPIAIAFGILDIPGATPTSLSIVLAAQALPVVVTLPFGGAIADRLGAARVIAVTDIILSAFVFTMAVLFITDTVTIPLLVVLALCTGVLHGLWFPAFIGLTPAVVEEHQLQQANAALAVASNLGMFGGAAVGGILVTFIGSGWAIAVDGLTFLVAGLLIFSIRHVSVRRDSGESMIYDVVHGWRVFWSYKWVVAVVVAFSFIVMVLRGTDEVMGPVLAKQIYGGAAGWSVVLSVMSLGMLVGAVIATRIRVERPIRFGMLLTLTAVIWLLLLAFEAPLWMVAVGGFVWGASIELFMVLWNTALQTHIPREALSRVSSYDAMGSLMFGPLGLAIAGPMVDVIGLQAGFLIGAGVIIVAVVGSLFSRSVRELRTASAVNATA